MKVFNTPEELQHQAFNFTLTERLFHGFHKSFQIMLHVFSHHKKCCLNCFLPLLPLHQQLMGDGKIEEHLSPLDMSRESPFSLFTFLSFSEKLSP